MTQDIIQRVVLKPEGGSKTVTVLEQVRSQLKGVKTDAQAASQQMQSVSGGSGGRLATARSAAGAAGGALAGVGGSQAASAVSSVLGLTATLGPLGALAGVATIGLGAFSSAIRKTEEDLTSRIRVEQEVARAIRDSTREQLQARLEAAQSELDIDQEILRQRTLAFAQYNTEIASQPLALGAALAGLDGKYNALKGTMEEASRAVSDNRIRVDALTVAYNNNATEVADLTALYKQLDQVELDYAAASLAANKLTSEQRQAHIADLQAEIDSYQGLIDSGAVSAETVTDLEAKISKLTVQQGAYAAVVESTADVLAKTEARIKAVSDQTDQYFDLLGKEVALREDIFATEQEILAAQVAAAEAAAKIIAEGEAAANEIRAEGEDRRQEIIADGRDNILKIERDFLRANTDAVRKRDVVAAITARERAKDALDDEKRASDKSLESQAKAERKSLEQQEKAQRNQLASVAEALNKELTTKRAAQARQQQELQSVLFAEQQMTTIGFATQRGIHASGWNDIGNIAAVGMANLIGVIISSFNNANLGGSPTPVFPPLITGGSGSSGGGMGGFSAGAGSMTFNIRADTRRQTLRMIDRRLREVWED